MKLRDHLDKLGDTIAQLAASSIRQEEQLKYHIRRTDLLEESVELLRKEIRPVKKHVDFVNSAAKIIASAVAIFAGIIAILGYWK